MGIPVVGYETSYLVNENGEVYSIKNKKYLKPNITKNGYATVQLFQNGKGKRLLVHRLVAQAFIPNPNNYLQVNHKDEDKLNNRINNLEWCNAIYNMNYGTRLERQIKNTDYSREQYKIIARQNGKKVSKKVIQLKNGKIIAKYNSAKEASIITHSNHSHICECCNGKR